MFNQQVSYDIAILIKTPALDKSSLQQYYINHFTNKSVIAFDVYYNEANKAPVKAVVEPCLDEVLPVLDSLDVKVLFVADSNYYKKLTGSGKVDSKYGYVVDCTYKNYTHMKVCLVPNYQAMHYDPRIGDKIDLCIEGLNTFFNGSYKEIGTQVIHKAMYVPCEVLAVRKALSELYKHPSITLDTETFSLKHNRAGLGTIGFAWSQHEGICIDVDHGRKTTGMTLRARYVDDYTVGQVMMEIKKFLITYQGNIKYHNATYDVKVLIRWLWMKDLMDTEGLLEGLEVLTRDFDCTQAITYLATNSTAGNKLSLKEQAQEFLGAYAVAVKDIRKALTRNLMIYNLKDCLATWFVYNKNYPIMVSDDQLNFYNTMAKPILKNIIQMELTGMPLNIDRVIQVNKKLQSIVDRYSNYLLNSKIIQQYSLRKREQIMREKNAAYKTKVITVDDVKYTFNSGSGDQVADLLHNYLGFEVFKTTPSGQPATGGKELKGHMKRTDNKEYKNIIRCIMKIEEGKKIISTFLSKFIDSERDDSGWHWLFGCFKFGGTISGRLSSSDPSIIDNV